MSTVHVRYDGNSQDVDFADVFRADRLASIGLPEGTEVIAGRISVDNVKNAVAQYLDIGVDELHDYDVEFSKNGNITVRPAATFG